MIKILLVEDDANKRAAMSEAVLSIAGIHPDALVTATDVVDAKKRLKESGYDLLLLDIHLPKRADQHPEPGGGLDILRWLKGSGKAFRPTYIVGTTAYDVSYQLAQAEFNNLIWTLIPFSFSENSWRAKLGATVQAILDQLVPPYSNDGVTFKVDALLVTALESPELKAVLELPVEWSEAKVRFDDSRYFRARVVGDDHSFDIVCVAASDKGLSSAGIATSKAIHAFRPKIVLMPGICAVVRNRALLGDVVVGDPSYDWGSGKAKVDKEGGEYFHPAHYQRRLDETLSNLAKDFRANPGRLKPFYDEFAQRKPDAKRPAQAPEVHVAAFASGAAVLQSDVAVQRIIDDHKDLKAIDMEVFSVMLACDIASHPRPLGIAAKAGCDFGDDDKSDDFQEYAAFISANFALTFLKRYFVKSED